MKSTRKQRNDLIQIRRERILELLSEGYTNHSEISRRLNVSRPTVTRDIFFLKKQSRDRMEIHIQETIPFEYMRCMEGLRRVLWESNQLLNPDKDNDDKNRNREKPDLRSKIQLLQLIATVHKDMLSISADGSIVQQAIEKIKVIQSKSKPKQSEDDIAKQELTYNFEDREAVTFTVEEEDGSEEGEEEGEGEGKEDNEETN